MHLRRTLLALSIAAAMAGCAGEGLNISGIAQVKSDGGDGTPTGALQGPATADATAYNPFDDRQNDTAGRREVIA